MSELVDRLRALFGSSGVNPVKPADLPFAVGDRVRSIVGPWYGTVVAIDLEAEHGLGRVTVRRDGDGAILHQAAIAHGLEPENRTDR
jgi:hypothetical protein